ncbi:MAG: zf-TFIIB domain-containing protein [Flavobacteriaceae bacterium]
MKCPVDDEQLAMTERNGVEIDYCPKCRGVWLDRGELDKIIERSAQAQPDRPPRDSGVPHQQGQYRKKKRESFLSELFDF